MKAAPRVALAFPGQGSQSVGMGKETADRYAEARGVFERADATLQYPLSRACFDGQYPIPVAEDDRGKHVLDGLGVGS